MGTIDDTLEPLDRDTIVDFLEGRHKMVVVDPKEIFPHHNDAEMANCTIHIEHVGDGTSKTTIIIEGCGIDTLMRLVSHITYLRATRIDS